MLVLHDLKRAEIPEVPFTGKPIQLFMRYLGPQWLTGRVNQNRDSKIGSVLPDSGTYRIL
jgi:hypothetical protein